MAIKKTGFPQFLSISLIYPPPQTPFKPLPLTKQTLCVDCRDSRQLAPRGEVMETWVNIQVVQSPFHLLTKTNH